MVSGDLYCPICNKHLSSNLIKINLEVIDDEPTYIKREFIQVPCKNNNHFYILEIHPHKVEEIFIFDTASISTSFFFLAYRIPTESTLEKINNFIYNKVENGIYYSFIKINGNVKHTDYCFNIKEYKKLILLS